MNAGPAMNHRRAMNILIMSVGRRCEIVEYFRHEFDSVVAVDITEYAPALYYASKHYILEKDFDDPAQYLASVLDICKKERIDGVLSLIDPDLSLLAEHHAEFAAIGAHPLQSEPKLIEATFDKMAFYRDYHHILSMVPTYASPEELLEHHQLSSDSPAIAKPARGSGSVGLTFIHYENEFKTIKFKHKYNYIYQPFVKNTEIGLDLYFDLRSHRIVSAFMKEKIAMRSGETDKALSIFREDVWNEVKKLELCGEFSGPVDVDVFIAEDGAVYINEVNPRFGGGYPMAHACGVDHVRLLRRNLDGENLSPGYANYTLGVKMMKHNQVFILPPPGADQ